MNHRLTVNVAKRICHASKKWHGIVANLYVAVSDFWRRSVHICHCRSHP